jgi:phosphopantothenoylcysteine decarboxylase / phosphopantothenate---cysteine ligase
VVPVETAGQMHDACHDALPADIAVFVAAVSDWRVAVPQARKLKKVPGGAPPELRLAANPDILAEIAAPGPNRPRLVIGFAAETDNVVANAVSKRQRKGCDWLLANDVSEAGGVMGGAMNCIQFVTAEGVESWPRLAKEAVAAKLAERIAAALEAS